MREAFADRPTTVADYLGILRRRLWIIVVPAVVAAIAAYAVAQAQKPLYRASAEILVSRSSVVSAITNVSDPSLGDATRFLATVASVARSPELADRVASAAGVPGVTGDEVLGASNVTPSPAADLLDVSVSWSNPGDAVRLTNAYAREFTRYKTELDTNKINDALRSLKQRIKALQATGATSTPSYSTLVQYQSQLETIGTLMANNTSVLRPAGGAANVRPQPIRRAILGAVIGGVVGLGLAFLAEALDRRSRSESEIAELLKLPLIGRLPKPSRHLRNHDSLVTLAEPASVQAESYQGLKTTIEFLTRGRPARTIMMTSAVPREGKSTTVANLAVAFARSGRRVVLVDLDLRRPFLHRLFSIDADSGIIDVIADRKSLAQTLRPIVLNNTRLTRSEHSKFTAANGSSGNPIDRTSASRILHLLPAGTISSAGSVSSSSHLENERLAGVLAELADQFDLVLLDTAPLLAVGDAMMLTSHVDAVALVLRAGIERPLLYELARQLQTSQAPALGFILTGTAEGDGYSYAYGYGSYSYDTGTQAERGAGRV